jgi:hypothetical protein
VNHKLLIIILLVLSVLVFSGCARPVETPPVPGGTSPSPGAGMPGYSMSDPAPVGTTLTVDDWNWGNKKMSVELTLLETVRGDQAWRLISEANAINPAPKDGKEYMMAKFRYRLTKLEPEGQSFTIGPLDFDLVSDGVVEKGKLAMAGIGGMNAELYSGGTKEGWVVYEVPKNATSPMIAYGRMVSGSGGLWFKT